MRKHEVLLENTLKLCKYFAKTQPGLSEEQRMQFSRFLVKEIPLYNKWPLCANEAYTKMVIREHYKRCTDLAKKILPVLLAKGTNRANTEAIYRLRNARCTCVSTFGSKEVCVRCYALAPIHPEFISNIAKDVLKVFVDEPKNCSCSWPELQEGADGCEVFSYSTHDSDYLNVYLSRRQLESNESGEERIIKFNFCPNCGKANTK
jgi:hypothetical protein